MADPKRARLTATTTSTTTRGGEIIIRGTFSEEEDETELKHGVPLFSNKQQAIDWCKNLSPNGPRYLRHAITTFVGWSEVKQYLLPRILNKPLITTQDSIDLSNNRFMEENKIIEGIQRRLSLPHHCQNLSQIATANSLKYSFFHMRCGILVQIRDNKVYTFAPFVNDQYVNSWGSKLKTDPSPLNVYYSEKRRQGNRPENILDNVNNWWANGNIICNEHDSTKNGNETTTQWWGDNMLLPFKHMIEQVCKERKIPDCDFFFNKRDHPQLRTDCTIEPYDFLFDEKNTKITPKENQFNVLAPFLSFYCSEEFSDLPIPTTEDWKGAIGIVFPETAIPDFKGAIKEPSDLYLEENLKKFNKKWKEKVETAFFRGSATGGGITPETNQRLNLSKLNNEWKTLYPNLLDAGITNFNIRDKKIFGEPMRYANKNELNQYKVPFTPMFQQGMYKYIIYVEGHCAANRYAFLMRLGSVIIKIASTCTASELWFFPLLNSQNCSRDFGSEETTEADHVLVKSDLSDLKEKLDWCKRNDLICQTIAQNAKRLYQEKISKHAILDYWQLLLIEISKNQLSIPLWWKPNMFDLVGSHLDDKPYFRLDKHRNGCAGNNKFCSRCSEQVFKN